MSVIPFRPREPRDERERASSGSERRRTPDLRTPVVFISHGSPLAVVEDDFKQALRQFGAHLRPPRAVLAVSAHWHGIRPLRASSSPQPSTMHDDFEGFPGWLSSLTYHCPGEPAVAEDVVGALTAAGIPAMTDPARGLDSGVWLPLSLIYPTAKVPVLQLSLPAPVTPQEMLAVGAALAPLRRRGVMLFGSGGVVHNPARVRFDARATTEPWALAFDQWVRDRVEAFDIKALCDYRAKAPSAYLAAPTSEHLDPLFFALGARLPGDAAELLFEGFHAGNLSLRSYVLRGKRAEDRRLPDRLALGG